MHRPRRALNARTSALGRSASSACPLIPAITIIAKFIGEPFLINEQSRQRTPRRSRDRSHCVFQKCDTIVGYQNLHKAPCIFVDYCARSSSSLKKDHIFPKSPKSPRPSKFMNISLVIFVYVCSINFQYHYRDFVLIIL